MISRQVEEDVQYLVREALSVAKSVIETNRAWHAAMSRELETAERLDGKALQDWLAKVVVPDDLREFVQNGSGRGKTNRQSSTLGN